AGDGRQVQRQGVVQRQPGDLVQFARSFGRFGMEQGRGVGHEEAGVEAARPARRGDGAGDIGQGGQVGQGADSAELAPRPGDGGDGRGCRQHQAGLLEGFARGGQGQGAGATGAAFTGQSGGVLARQVGDRGGGVVGPLYAPAGK